MTVESYRQNNFTADLATKEAADTYWLGYKVRLVTSGGGYLLISTVQAQNNLATNTLASDGGNQISQYYGHWALDQPDIGQGQCVQVYNIISTISITSYFGVKLRKKIAYSYLKVT